MTRLFTSGENFKEMVFLPRVGDYISEMWHGRVCSDNPLFTAPHITVGGEVYDLGQYVRYCVPGDSTEYVGKLISFFEVEGQDACRRTHHTFRSYD